jgi:hypothetical protein
MAKDGGAPIRWQDELYDLLRVKSTDPPAYKRNMDPSACRNRFRAALPVGG